MTQIKFKIEKQKLTKALDITTKALNKKATLPVLEYLYLDFINESGTKYIAITGTDLENTIVYYIYTDFPDKASPVLLMDPVKLKTFLQKITIEDIKLEFYQNSLTVKAGKNIIKLNISEEIDTFPKINDFEEDFNLNIPYNEFKKLIDTAINFTSIDKLRPVMGGIHINQLKDKSFDFVSTDAYSLFKFNNKNITFEGENITFTIPKTIKSLLPTSDIENINITGDDKFICLTIDNIIIYSKLLENNYPNYDSVIPKDNPFNIILNKKEVLNALELSILTVNESKSIALSITKDKTIINAKDLDFNREFKTELEVNSKIKEEITIGLNNLFLIKILKSLSNEEFILEYNDPSKAILIKSIKNKNVMFLLMPIMINS